MLEQPRETRTTLTLKYLNHASQRGDVMVEGKILIFAIINNARTCQANDIIPVMRSLPIMYSNDIKSRIALRHACLSALLPERVYFYESLVDDVRSADSALCQPSNHVRVKSTGRKHIKRRHKTLQPSAYASISSCAPPTRLSSPNNLH